MQLLWIDCHWHTPCLIRCNPRHRICVRIGLLALPSPTHQYASSDLWVAAQDCTSCGNVATFNPSSSSTFKNESKPFQIQYGTGDAAGSLGSDTVQMAGFSVPNQVFAVCDQVSSGLLDTPVSGLMGLAWNTIASSGATPFWQTLAGSNVWDSPLMAFHLTRYDSRFWIPHSLLIPLQSAI